MLNSPLISVCDPSLPRRPHKGLSEVLQIFSTTSTSALLLHFYQAYSLGARLASVPPRMPQNLFTLELRLTECSYCVFGKADASISWEQPTPPQRAAAAEMEVGPREAEGAPPLWTRSAQLCFSALRWLSLGPACDSLAGVRRDARTPKPLGRGSH